MAVLIVGGGITGLTAARALGRAGIPTMLVEASRRLGGKIGTEHVDGFLVETGPDSFISYRPAALRLCEELGLAGAIIRPSEPRTVTVRTGGRFVRLPDGMGLVLPTRLAPFVMTPMFSPREKLRAGLDLVLPRAEPNGDVAVGAVLRRRLGDAVVDRLAGPLIGGVYDTPIDDLSADAVVPQIREAERDHRSLMLASLAQGRARRRAAGTGEGSGSSPGGRAGSAPHPSPSPFVSLAGGIGQLTAALVAAVGRMSGVELRTGTRVTGLEREGAGIAVLLDDGTRIRPEAVILALPAGVTADLLEDVAPAAAAHLGTIPHGSTGVVNLGFRVDQLPGPVEGHGFLVAEDEPLTISACTWSSQKWTGRAPDGSVLLRAFLGRGSDALLAEPDETVVAAVRRDLEGTLGIRSEPVLARVSRFPGLMPRYTVGHLERVAAVSAGLASLPGVVLAGAAYRGVGLPDCVTQGRAAAELAGRIIGGRGPAGGAVVDPPPAPGSPPPVPAAPAGSSPGGTLDRVATGSGAWVLSVGSDHRDELSAEGLRPGVRVDVDSAAPLGGPLVVSVGRARVALARAVARTVVVSQAEPAAEIAEPGGTAR